MLRNQKIEIVEGMAKAFGSNPHMFLTRFSGISVNQSTELRRKIREVGGTYRVIKNRLAKRAAAGTGVEKLVDHLTGPCAIAGHQEDPVGLAKVLSDFSKENPQLELIAGVIDAQQVLDPAGVKYLASLPGLPELRAQLLSVIQAPATRLVRLLGTPGGQIARALDARRENLEGGE